MQGTPLPAHADCPRAWSRDLLVFSPHPLFARVDPLMGLPAVVCAHAHTPLPPKMEAEVASSAPSFSFASRLPPPARAPEPCSDPPHRFRVHRASLRHRPDRGQDAAVLRGEEALAAHPGLRRRLRRGHGAPPLSPCSARASAPEPSRPGRAGAPARKQPDLAARQRVRLVCGTVRNVAAAAAAAVP